VPLAEPDLVSLLVLGGVLGGVVSADGVDDVDGVLGGAELLVLSELLGALLDDGVLMELDEVDEPWTPSADRVCVSRLAVVVRPLDCWKLFSAACVLGPILPSTLPALKPLSFRACWASRTSDWSLAPRDAEAEVSLETLGLWLGVEAAAEVSDDWVVEDGVFAGVCDEVVFAAAKAVPAIDRAIAVAIAVLCSFMTSFPS
jgi:hypothetical protein